MVETTKGMTPVLQNQQNVILRHRGTLRKNLHAQKTATTT